VADDAARNNVLLFGGFGGGTELGDTWTWDGTDWTQRSPADAPSRRYSAGTAYDAARGRVVLFGGGTNCCGVLGDTWAWDGTEWTQQPAGSIALTPRSGPPGTVVQVQAWGFAAGERVRLTFFDSTQGSILLEKVVADPTGAFTTQVTIPPFATLGKQRVKAKGSMSGEIAKRTFTVT
jgi:hypothetical protein